MRGTYNTTDADRDASGAPAIPARLPAEVLNLERLRARCVGNITLVQRVLEKFRQRFPHDLDELERALETRDAEEAARIAHRIKGSAANISAGCIQRAATEIEDLSREDRSTDASTMCVQTDRLHREWENFLEHTSALFSAGDVG